MAKKSSARHGSLQFWPRKRVSKYLPDVNWKIIKSENILNGFIAYKAGMASAFARDNTPNSMTNGKDIAVPVTVLECPPMKIFSLRLYKDGLVKDEIVLSNEKELKKKLKLSKETKKLDSIKLEEFDDARVIVYSLVKKTSVKKTPDLVEISLNGNLEEKINFVKENVGKELSSSTFVKKGDLLDVRGVTKGKGLCGPVKRFGITLKFHKSEKGVRRPGTLAPWHPARVTFRAPISGQMGMFTRIVYNNKVVLTGKAQEIPAKLKSLKNYGDIKTEYVVLRGSIQGPVKRQVLLTPPLRPNRKQTKKAFELIDIR
jgi:large subunit ribosomal protein L3